MSLEPKPAVTPALAAFTALSSAQYPGSPSPSALSIRKPCPTTHMHGPPCFVVDTVLAVSALVHLDELQSFYERMPLGQGNCAQAVVRQLKQVAISRASRGFAGCMKAFDEVQDARALRGALLQLARQRAENPWGDPTNPVLPMTFWRDGSP